MRWGFRKIEVLSGTELRATSPRFIFSERGPLCYPEANRKAAGSKGNRLFRSEKDPNEVVILFEWQDLGKARLSFTPLIGK